MLVIADWSSCIHQKKAEVNVLESVLTQRMESYWRDRRVRTRQTALTSESSRVRPAPSGIRGPRLAVALPQALCRREHLLRHDCRGLQLAGIPSSSLSVTAARFLFGALPNRVALDLIRPAHARLLQVHTVTASKQPCYRHQQGMLYSATSSAT